MVTTCAFSMVSDESEGFVKLIESVKILEIEACATTFMRMWGFGGGYKVGVW